MPDDSDFLAALRALREGGVEVAVVGGLAAVLNGAPVSTFDLDIVPARDEDNAARLLGVLDSLDAVYRILCLASSVTPAILSPGSVLTVRETVETVSPPALR